MGGIGDLSTLAAESLGGAIGLGFRLPKYQDNSAQMELSRLKAERDAQAKRDKELSDEKKNWQIDYSSVHPVLQPEVEAAYAELSKKTLDALRQDPKHLQSRGYFENLEKTRITYENAKADTKAINHDITLLDANKDVVTTTAPLVVDAIKRGDATQYRGLYPGRYAQGAIIAPNVDLVKETDEILKRSLPGKKIDDGSWKVTGDGLQMADIRPVYDPNIVEQQARNSWRTSRAIQLIEPNEDVFVLGIQKMADQAQKTVSLGTTVRNIPKQKSYGYGAGGEWSNDKWTVTPMAPNTTISIKTFTGEGEASYTNAKGEVKTIKAEARKQTPFVALRGYNFEAAGKTIKDVPPQGWTTTEWINERGQKQKSLITEMGHLQAVIQNEADKQWYVQLLIPTQTVEVKDKVTKKIVKRTYPEHNIWIKYDKDNIEKVRAFTANSEGKNGWVLPPQQQQAKPAGQVQSPQPKQVQPKQDDDDFTQFKRKK